MSERILIVSNRLPYSIERKSGRYELRQSSGGLVSAIKSISPNKELVWLGAADFKEELWLEYKKSAGSVDIPIVPLFLNKKTEKLYYNSFSNTLIWPLFHYFPSFAEYDVEAYKAYVEVNQLFANSVKAVAREGDLVWIQDYHLMLLPGFLKHGASPVSSSFFLHIPFPSYEIVKLIPEDWRNEILKSLLCADVIGFQTEEYAYHFKKSLSFFLNKECRNDKVSLNGHEAWIRQYPISVDFSQFHSAYDLPQVVRRRELIRQKHRQVKIIFSLDRLDYSKGVINRLQAYEELLRFNPSLRGNLVFIINVVPSREEISKYAERKRIIEENISRINGLYGSIQWQPILYQYQHLTFDDLLACYTACDVALVTPLRDGMNLVAKEFVASRKDRRGSLILSEFAGSANELDGAILVNPNDVDAMQAAILKALKLKPAEQEERMSRMQAYLQVHDVKAWSDSCLEDMKQARKKNCGMSPRIMTFEDKLQLLEAYSAAGRRLILLDYDGTLVRFYDRPEEAVPGEVIRDLVARLAANPLNRVVIVSGRDAATLTDWFGDLDVGIAAEHGLLHRETQNSSWSRPENAAVAWKARVRSLIRSYSDELPGSFIEEKQYAIAWHYRAVEDVSAETVRMRLVKELSQLKEELGFEILAGNKVLEVKSRGSGKGKFVQQMLLQEPYDFVLAIGDDVTDEDMFAVLDEAPQHFSIKVGLSPTGAKLSLLNVNNVLSLLDQMSTMQNKLGV